MSDWQPIETAPRDRDCEEILVYLDQAEVPLVRLAWWVPDDDLAQVTGTPSGWWSATSSCGQELLWWQPTHWAPFHKPLDTPAEKS
jgi:hypothetical protein